MRKWIIIIIILGLIFLGYFYYRNFYHKYGTLIIKTAPLNVNIQINNNNYTVSKGYLKIQLTPGQYNLVFTAPGYYSENKAVTIIANTITDLEPVYLLRSDWQPSQIINNENIEFFTINGQSNLLIYLTAINKKYDWHIYNRLTKEDEKFYQSASLPLNVYFTDDNRKILIELKPQDWWILFLPKSLITNGININSAFIEQLKKQQNIKKDFVIKQIILSSNDDEVIIRTNDGIYKYNYINRELEQLFDEATSNVIIQHDILYFIKKNGLLTKLDLLSGNLEDVSLFKFYNEGDSSLDKIKIYKDTGTNSFLIQNLDSNYLLLEKQTIPQKLEFNFDKIIWNFNNKSLLTFSSSSKLTTLYDFVNNIKTNINITSNDIPHWFLNNDYLLFIYNNNLNVYNIKKNSQYNITNNIKNNLYYYDAILKYIYYLDNDGIKLISL